MSTVRRQVDSKRARRDRRRQRLAAKLLRRRTKIAAILDTNVILDIVSAHDVADGYSKAQADAFFRLDRAAYGLRAAIYLHATGSSTLSAREALELTLLRAPPGSEHGLYVNMWLRSVKPKVLRRWTMGMVTIDGSGSTVDDGLIALAKRFKCPLVSNEGIGPDGPTGKRGIRTKAPAAGVRVMTTEEFCGAHRLSGTRRKRFLRELAGSRIHRQNGIFDYYLKLLLGTEPDAVEERRLQPA